MMETEEWRPVVGWEGLYEVSRGLVGTGAWRDPVSASRYEHVVVSEESRKGELLPTENDPCKTRVKAASRAKTSRNSKCS
jgi:hypothetical protein